MITKNSREEEGVRMVIRHNSLTLQKKRFGYSHFTVELQQNQNRLSITLIG